MLATDYTWNTDSGNWNTGGNWTPSGPPVAGDTAAFGNHAATVTVTVPTSGSSAVTQATINSTTTDYTISIASGETLTFSDTGVLDAQLLLSSASNTLTVSGGAASLVMDSTNTTNFYVSSSGSGVLALSCGITDNGSGYNLEVNNGVSGIVTMSGTASNVYTGSTDLLGGTLRLNKSGGAVAIPADTSVGISSGSTLLVQANAQFGSGAAVQILSGGTANFQTFDSTIGSLEFLGGTYSQSGGTVTISGNASLRNVTLDSGAGTITFSGANQTISFAEASGTATIAGNLNLGGSNKNFSVNNGSAAVDMAVSAIIANGQVTKQGTGNLRLSGANIYTGSTTVSAGTLSIGGTGTIATSSGLNLSTSGAAFDISPASGSITIGDLTGVSGTTITLGSNSLTAGTSSTTTFTGAIGGSGGFTKQGSGTLTLNNTNSHTGGTTVTAGVLSLGSSGTISSGDLTVSGGTFSISSGGGGKQVNNLSGASGTTVSLGANTLTVSSTSDTAYAGSITGTGGLTKQGTAILSLQGDSTYSGATAVSAGTLRIGSTLGNTAVTVGGSGTLTGTGTIGTGTASVINNGTLTVATPTTTGTLTIAGSLTNGASGIVNLDVSSASVFDKVVVQTGAVSLNGTLNLGLLSGGLFNQGDSITLIDNATGSGISGTFSSVNFSGFSSNPTLIYNANAVLLQFTSSSASTATPFLSSYASLGVPIVSETQQLYLNYLNRLQSIRRQMRPAAPETVALATADLGDAIDSPTTPLQVGSGVRNRWTLFADGVGTLGRIYTTPTRYTSVGGLLGAAYMAPRYGLGLSTVYQTTNGKAQDGASSFQIKSLEAFFFSTYLPWDGYSLFVDLIAGGAANWYDIERLTTQGTAKGYPLGGQGNIYADAGYDFAYGKSNFAPYLGLGYLHNYIPAYNESGSTQALQIGAQNLDSLRTSLGFTMSYEFQSSNKVLIPQVRALWQREFLDHNQNVAYVSVPFNIAAQTQVFGVGRNLFFVGALVRLLAGDTFELHGSYDYEWNSGFHSNLLMFGVQGNF